MVKAGPDVYGENEGGFASDGSPIYGFSHMHDSGTGGTSSLGNFPIFAQSGCPNDDINACKYVLQDRMVDRINGTIQARPGYFGITLANNIRTEMTATNHTALYHFNFPETQKTPNTSLAPHILVELTDLPQTRGDSSITVYPDTGRMTGWGIFSPSFGLGRYRSYFCLDFDGAEVKDAGMWFIRNHAASATSLKNPHGNGKEKPSTRPAGGWVQFEPPTDGNQILVRVGMSFISEDKACANAEREIPDMNFSAVVQAAEDAWRAKLDVITIEDGGIDESLLRTFWSGVYRTMISPQDYTGENPHWNSEEPYYDSFYCIWDSFRSTNPLLTLLDPESQARMVRSLLDVYKHEGWLPDCRMSLCKGAPTSFKGDQ
jgi:putative alpha-1,2-mannosidase